MSLLYSIYSKEDLVELFDQKKQELLDNYIRNTKKEIGDLIDSFYDENKLENACEVVTQLKDASQKSQYSKFRPFMNIFKGKKFRKVIEELPDTSACLFTHFVGVIYTTHDDHKLARDYVKAIYKIKDLTTKSNAHKSLEQIQRQIINNQGNSNFLINIIKLITKHKNRLTRKTIQSLYAPLYALDKQIRNTENKILIKIRDEKLIDLFDELSSQEHKEYVFEEISKYLTTSVLDPKRSNGIIEILKEEKELPSECIMQISRIRSVLGNYEKGIEYSNKIKRTTLNQKNKISHAFEIAQRNLNPETGIDFLPEFYAGLRDTLDSDYENIDKWADAIINGLAEVARTGKSLSEVMGK
ncbi:hypothetical protein HOK51_03155 [Candidatus Woesearchaeota archaeon]|jgi:hypothetical protein|nr:hypothetical protein [Candidatus Woesearchaeota archaeon]MBT6518817.1 hypothetical protein [Candidatus Woesearchaeota archaeon]MBT7367956.1 hypothetical protein [Candidatus Woesearchaeota archaeon]